MGFLVSNLMIKILVGIAVVGTIVYYQQPHGGDMPCVGIEKVPGKSAVFQCPAGLSTAFIHDPYPYPVSTTLTTDEVTQAWLTNVGDNETLKTLNDGHLGKASVLKPGSFMSVNGTGLVYIYGKSKYLLSVAYGPLR